MKKLWYKILNFFIGSYVQEEVKFHLQMERLISALANGKCECGPFTFRCGEEVEETSDVPTPEPAPQPVEETVVEKPVKTVKKVKKVKKIKKEKK